MEFSRAAFISFRRTEVPRDSYSSDEGEDDDLDERITQRMQDKTRTNELDYSDSEDEGDNRRDRNADPPNRAARASVPAASKPKERRRKEDGVVDTVGGNTGANGKHETMGGGDEPGEMLTGGPVNWGGM